MKKVGLCFVVLLIGSNSFAVSKQDAFCICFEARSVLLVGAGMGKTARDYGADTDLPLLLWRKSIETWSDKLEVDASRCSLGSGEGSSVRLCRQYMKQYPDGNF
ncbi:MAG TPA: hypothetical protein VF412_18650 [Bdellovibrio sp.]|uniref:hypothetical protein n=1 Tax=Bdellovibrio sp. TaxID=28201 RepID=UPI002F230C4C